MFFSNLADDIGGLLSYVLWTIDIFGTFALTLIRELTPRLTLASYRGDLKVLCPPLHVLEMFDSSL
jgi:hypothetical protein